MALKGIKVIEMAGLAPGPLCGMILADHGASVIRVDKANSPSPNLMSRGKRSISIDLKKTEGVNIIKKLCSSADVLIEPFRKGVMEKLGLGPSVLCQANPRLVYARLTGYGQSGYYSSKAGHDINYIAVSGVLSKLGRSDSTPHPPVNLLADFAGGGLMCATGVLLALLERSTSGRGQVIDANMVHGSAYVSSFLWSSRNIKYGLNLWDKGRGKNLLDGGAPFYDTYRTKDNKYMAVGALEPQFYQQLLEGLGLDSSDYSQFSDWSSLRDKFTELFASKTQSEWIEVFESKDACVTPVLELDEAHHHEHNREVFTENETGGFDPSPAPSLSRTPATLVNTHCPSVGEHSLDILSELGLSLEEINQLRADDVVECRQQSKL